MDPLSTEFQIMCFILDTTSLTGEVTMSEVADKFGEDAVQSVITNGYVEVFESERLKWTELGWQEMLPDEVEKSAKRRINNKLYN
jgi:hypothetical protein